jgi:hypothetical protein
VTPADSGHMCSPVSAYTKSVCTTISEAATTNPSHRRGVVGRSISATKRTRIGGRPAWTSDVCRAQVAALKDARAGSADGLCSIRQARSVPSWADFDEAAIFIIGSSGNAMRGEAPSPGEEPNPTRPTTTGTSLRMSRSACGLSAT